ncbi:MAG: hypothetical protein ACYS6W_14915 [Planctomycetota bacterium]|jgi:hypothetical protein
MAKKSPKKKRNPTFGTGSAEGGWAIRRSKISTDYDLDVDSGHQASIKKGFGDFWGKLVREAAAFDNEWDVLFLLIRPDGASIYGFPGKFVGKNDKRPQDPPRIEVGVTFKAWQGTYDELPDPEEDEEVFQRAHERLEQRYWKGLKTAAGLKRVSGQIRALFQKNPFEIWACCFDDYEEGSELKLRQLGKVRRPAGTPEEDAIDAVCKLRGYQGQTVVTMKKGHVHEVDLTASKLKNADLAHLKAMPKLQRLRLLLTSIGDAGLAHVAKLTTLTHLSLVGTKVTDRGLEHLTSLTKLKRLNLRRCKVTKQGVKKLQRALPRLEKVEI